jgi:hypothetical protein
MLHCKQSPAFCSNAQPARLRKGPVHRHDAGHSNPSGNPNKHLLQNTPGPCTAATMPGENNTPMFCPQQHMGVHVLCINLCFSTHPAGTLQQTLLHNTPSLTSGSSRWLQGGTRCTGRTAQARQAWVLGAWVQAWVQAWGRGEGWGGWGWS